MSNDTHNDLVRLTTNYTIGSPGISENPNSALFRPWIRTFTQGGFIKKVTHLFLDSGLPKPNITRTEAKPIEEQYQYHVLGSLGLSSKGMVCFFPGFSFEQKRFALYSNERMIEERRNFIIDHFTLEPSYDKWHITSLSGTKRKRRVRNFKTQRLSNDLIHWFALDVRSYENFELLYQEYKFESPLPEADSERRTRIMAASREGIYQHIIRARDARVTSVPTFLHFDFWVRRHPVGGLEAIPQLPLVPVSRDVQMPANGVRVRVHEVFLPAFEPSIVIVATKLTGNLKENVMFSKS